MPTTIIHTLIYIQFTVKSYKASDVHLYTGLATRLNCQVSQNIPQYEKKTLFHFFNFHLY